MKYLILLLPLVYARINHDGITISIEPGPTEANTTIRYEGNDLKILTDKDKTAFNLTQEAIEKAVQVYSGEKATDVFIKSPTPWNDLYKTYKWREVKREFKIKDIRLINITHEERNMSIKDFRNDGNDTKVIKGEVRDAYDSFISRHYWSGNIKVNASLIYNLTRPYDPPLLYAYSSDVGQFYLGSGLNSITITKTRAKFTLEPNQTAKFYVKANQVTVRVMVEYETNLIGDVVVNYENKHEGHHFWAYDINEVLSASNMTSTVRTNEYVEVYYLQDFKTQIVDGSTENDIQFTNGFVNK